MIKAVIFDMDGLMIDSEKMARFCCEKAGKALGYNYTDELFFKEMGLTPVFIKELYFKHFGKDFKYDDFIKLKNQYVEEYIKESGIPVKPGLYELLKFLKNNGYKTAVATSTPRKRAEDYLTHIKVIEFFDKVICVDMIEKSKPNPEIYLKAADELNVKTEECFVLEDSPNGITAAYRAGIKTIMVPDLVSPDEELKKKLFACVKSLKDVIEILEKYNK